MSNLVLNIRLWIWHLQVTTAWSIRVKTNEMYRKSWQVLRVYVFRPLDLDNPLAKGYKHEYDYFPADIVVRSRGLEYDYYATARCVWCGRPEVTSSWKLERVPHRNARCPLGKKPIYFWESRVNCLRETTIEPLNEKY